MRLDALVQSNHAGYLLPYRVLTPQRGYTHGWSSASDDIVADARLMSPVIPSFKLGVPQIQNDFVNRSVATEYLLKKQVVFVAL